MDAPDARGAAAAKRVRDEQGHFIKADLNTGDDLVDFRLRNPLHDPIEQLKALIADIQKHQETRFDLKFSIPLIALPIIIGVLFGLGGFQLGRLTPWCPQYFSSEIGTLYSLTISVPNNKTPTQQALLKTDQTTYTLVMPTNFDSSRLHGTRVAISGMVNMCTHAIRIDTPQNVTVLNQ